MTTMSKAQIEAERERLYKELEIPEFRMDFRGGSQIDADRCEEYYRDWIEIKQQIAALNAAARELDNNAARNAFCAALVDGDSDAKNVATLSALFDFGSKFDNFSDLTDSVRAVVCDWYDTHRTDTEKMRLVRELLA